MSSSAVPEGTIRITFAGAAGTVTGSRYLVQTSRARVLVDCGLFQGLKRLRERNWAALPFSIDSLDAVVLTHAHIDHSGYLPRLIESGYRGRVFCTAGTRELLSILLPDSGYLQEEEARHANMHGYARHRPALPLYTRAAAERSLAQLTAVDFHQRIDVAPGVTASFSRAGHILGSACLTLTIDGKTVTFSGDVGRANDPIMKPPEPLQQCDALVIESTYGDRRHPADDVLSVLATIVRETVEKKGTLVVPAFAVGRAQHLLYLLSRLRAARSIPAVPIYLDSPMAISATEFFRHQAGDHKLSDADVEALCNVAEYTHTPDESRAIDNDGAPKIIISASGMATGGRVLHHLRRFLPDPRNTVLLVGYQAAGTRGRALLQGEDELKIHGQYVSVRARIAQLDGLSAHADYVELLGWLARSELTPRHVFVTHGEPSAADAMRRRLQDAFGWSPCVPEQGESYDIT